MTRNNEPRSGSLGTSFALSATSLAKQRGSNSNAASFNEIRPFSALRACGRGPPVCQIGRRKSGRRGMAINARQWCGRPPHPAVGRVPRKSPKAPDARSFGYCVPGCGQGRGRKHRRPRRTGARSSTPYRALRQQSRWRGQNGVHPLAKVIPLRLYPPTLRCSRGGHSCPRRSD